MKDKNFIILDIIASIYLSAPILVAWWISASVIYSLGWFGMLIFPFIFCFSFSIGIFLLRLPLDKLKRGVIEIGLNKKYISWFLNLTLYRSFLSCGLNKFFMSMAWSRFLVFKSLGAKISYYSNFALNAEITDLSMVEIGKHTLVGDHVKISAHLLNNKKIILKPISIQENCILLPGSYVMPGTKLEAGKVFGKDKES